MVLLDLSHGVQEKDGWASMGEHFGCTIHELPARSGHFQVTSPSSQSSPSRVPYHATISLDPITTHTRKSREPEIFFSSPLVTANCFVCASLSEIIIPPGPRPRLDETPVVHAVFRFSLLDKDVEKHLAYLGIPWINLDHKDVRMGESGRVASIEFAAVATTFQDGQAKKMGRFRDWLVGLTREHQGGQPSDPTEPCSEADDPRWREAPRPSWRTLAQGGWTCCQRS